MAQFKKASEVDVTAEDLGKSDDELRRERSRAAVRARQAKREALKMAGADLAPSSDDLVGRLEHGLKARDKALAKQGPVKRQNVKTAVSVMRYRKEAS